MHEISQIDQNLIQELFQTFGDVNLKDDITLLEEDFADTSYLRRYPHQQPYDVDSQDYFSKNNLFEEINNSELLPEEKSDLVLAINEGKRLHNKYKTWQEVPFRYLNQYAHGFYFVIPSSYVFYTPALIMNLILDKECFKGNAFDVWLSRLLMQNEDKELLLKFNTYQLILIKKFLCNLLLDKYVKKFIEVDDVESAIKMISDYEK